MPVEITCNVTEVITIFSSLRSWGPRGQLEAMAAELRDSKTPPSHFHAPPLCFALARTRTMQPAVQAIYSLV